MPDIDDELRGLFRRKADEVQPHRTVPRPMVIRARRRIALNAMGMGLAVALLASGAFAGVHALGLRSSPEPVGRSPHPPTATTPTVPASARPTPTHAPSPSTNQACVAAQVGATASLSSGAAGSREGEIVVTNLSGQTCTLQGTPTITLLDQNQRPITSGVTFGSSQPAWQANASPKPAGWPVVTLQPGARASFRARWGNWCLNGGAEPIWRITVPGSGTIIVGGFDASMMPPCNGPAQPSSIDVGPFEPRAGP